MTTPAVRSTDVARPEKWIFPFVGCGCLEGEERREEEELERKQKKEKKKMDRIAKADSGPCLLN